MLWRLFSKAKSIPDRVHYRMAPSRADGVGVQIVSGEGHPISGRLVNMSAGGAAIEFDESVERDLQLGVERQITFSSLNSTPRRSRARNCAISDRLSRSLATTSITPVAGS